MNNKKKTTKNQNAVVSISQIQYTFISTHTAYKPNEYFDTAFRLLKEFPKDLLQLRDSADFFEFCYQLGIRKGINLYMLPCNFFTGQDDENYKIFESYSGMFNKDLVKVFLIDKDIDNHEKIAAILNRYKFGYYVFVGNPGAKNESFYNRSKSFVNGHELIDLIQADLALINEEIKRVYSIEIDSFNLARNPNADQMNPYYPSLYAKTNYYILNQILGNFWLKRPDEPKREDIELYSKKRATLQLDQSKVIDCLHQSIHIKQNITPIEPYLPPMVVIAPFHFPRYGKILKKVFETKKEKMLLRVSQTEQLPDYTYEIDEEVRKHLKDQEIGLVLSVLTKRLLLLDDLGFLHAQFHYSPVYRLPIAGKSLNMDLSHFQRSFPNKKSAIKKIGIIGDLLREQLVSKQLQGMLMERNGQLVFISDLPMEWLKIGNYPLSLTHDICRIPEFNFSSLINNYIHSQRLNFRIQQDILKRTLIIHCASDDEEDMHQIFEIYEALQASLGYTSIICTTIEEVSDAVKKYKPDLLIFDCHGDFDEKDLSSYLVIDDENDILLTGDDIIKHQISAPLVFISACSTMPNYGYVKFLSDAFFQAGAFAVTATFLPIKMGDAAVLLIRLLNGLKLQETKTIFSNWLAFVSHTLRSTLIFETIRTERKKNNLKKDIEDQRIAEILLDLMVFSKRKDAFENLQAYLKTINPTIDTLFENLDHEWLSYTTIGRADLIYFQNWLHEHQQENFGESL
ncbi:hypothetical protein GCM10022246_15350 [Pedobacter ginsengiterrae]|uniref:CHAT domain-containing protein n=1 Tax=Pedobacter ginsengiterrae TaxID=871696 RepID=A0ABP7PCH6_9SPHI